MAIRGYRRAVADKRRSQRSGFESSSVNSPETARNLIAESSRVGAQRAIEGIIPLRGWHLNEIGRCGKVKCRSVMRIRSRRFPGSIWLPLRTTGAHKPDGSDIVGNRDGSISGGRCGRYDHGRIEFRRPTIGGTIDNGTVPRRLAVTTPGR